MHGDYLTLFSCSCVALIPACRCVLGGPKPLLSVHARLARCVCPTKLLNTKLHFTLTLQGPVEALADYFALSAGNFRTNSQLPCGSWLTVTGHRSVSGWHGLLHDLLSCLIPEQGRRGSSYGRLPLRMED